MVGLTGDMLGTGGISAPVATIMGVFSLLGIVASGWLSKRSGRRRTGPAPSPTDTVDVHTRLTTIEHNLAEARRTFEAMLREYEQLAATVSADGRVTRGRLQRLEDRVWPPT